MCRFEGAGTGSVKGRVEIRQANTTSPAVFRVEVRGLGSSAKHGLHVHQRGDTGDNCGAAGGHFNPLHVSSELCGKWDSTFQTLFCWHRSEIALNTGRGM